MILTRVSALGCLIFLRILVNTNESKSPDQPNTFKTKKIELTVNPLWSTNYSSKLTPLNWERSVMNAVIYLKKPINTAILRIELFKFTNQYRPFLLNVTVDCCQWLVKKEQNKYYAAFFNLMLKFTNVNHTCPITDVVRAEGLYFEPKLANYNFPPGKFMLIFTLFDRIPGMFISALKIVMVVQQSRSF